MGLGAIGLGSGNANAKPHNPGPPIPPIPGMGDWAGGPPGHNPWGPPGQVKKWETIDGVPDPYQGVPPGHWDDRTGMMVPWVWLPPGIPDVTQPLEVAWNEAATAWGVWMNPNWLIPYVPS
jgi:hypothetical protein